MESADGAASRRAESPLSSPAVGDKEVEQPHDEDASVAGEKTAATPQPPPGMAAAASAQVGAVHPDPSCSKDPSPQAAEEHCGSGAEAAPDHVGEEHEAFSSFKHSCRWRRPCLAFGLAATLLTVVVLGYEVVVDKIYGPSHAPSNSVYYHTWSGTTDNMEVDHVWIIIPTPSEEDGNAIFASTQYRFENNVGGYIGTQVWREGVFDKLGAEVGSVGEAHQAIFAVWDKDPEHQVTWRGENCGRFGGEGTGSHCRIKFALQEGRRYTLRVELSGATRAGVGLTGFLTDTLTQKVSRIGTLLLPNTPGHQGFGRLRTQDTISFQEYYMATGCNGQALSSVGLLGPYASNRTVVADHAWASHHREFGCVRSDVGACIPGYGCGAPRVFFLGGGATVRTTADHRDLWQASQFPWRLAQTPVLLV